MHTHLCNFSLRAHFSTLYIYMYTHTYTHFCVHINNPCHAYTPVQFQLESSIFHAIYMYTHIYIHICVHISNTCHAYTPA